MGVDRHVSVVSHNITMDARNNIIDGRRRSRRSGSSYTERIAKRTLFICWVYTVLYIWFAPDGYDEANLYDASIANSNFDYIFVHKGQTTSGAKRSSPTNIHVNKSSRKVNDNSWANITTIPEALQPITYNECCVPAILNGIENPRDIKCFGTCYNERVCSDSSYPYSSLNEKEKFRQQKPYKEFSHEYVEATRRCFVEPKWLIPNVTWCKSDNLKKKSIEAAEVYGNTPIPGCSLLSDSQGGPWQHVYIFPSAKLAFCGIPKVGITQWIQFARFVAGAKDYPSIPHYKLDIDFFRFDTMNPSVQQEIWQNENEWKWGVFLRDPAERLLSAYLDKVSTKRGQGNVQRVYGHDGHFTFHDFVNRLAMTYNKTGCWDKDLEKDRQSGMTGLNLCSNPHWRPQIMSCGLHDRLDRFQFLGDISNSPDHTRQLLQSVGLWESHGRHFINGGITRENNIRLHDCSIKSYPYMHEEHRGFQQKDNIRNTTAANTAYGHSTGSQGKMEEYYTPELLNLVRMKLYSDDYKLYQLVSAKEELSNGREIARQLSGTDC